MTRSSSRSRARRCVRRLERRIIPSVSPAGERRSASSSVAVSTGRPMAEVGVLGPDPGVVEPGRDRVRLGDLPVLVGEERRARAVQDARPSAAEARGAVRLDADEPHVHVVDEAGEDADRV